VLSLYIFGGAGSEGFSFALVVGILIGTYSSIAVAAPMLVAWQEWRAAGKTAVLPAAKRARRLRFLIVGFFARAAPFLRQAWHPTHCSGTREAHFCGTVLKPGTFRTSRGV
jgi:hypothetical protein